MNGEEIVFMFGVCLNEAAAITRVKELKASKEKIANSYFNYKVVKENDKVSI